MGALHLAQGELRLQRAAAELSRRSGLQSAVAAAGAAERLAAGANSLEAYGASRFWVGARSRPRNWTAGFSSCVHLPGFHVGYLFLTHSQINGKEATAKVGNESNHFRGPFEMPIP